MNELLPVVIFVAGLIVGAAAIIILRNGDVKRLRHQEAELTEAQSAKATAQALLQAEQAATAEKLSILDAAQRKLSDAFAALSADALRSNNQSFLELATATLEKYRLAAKGDLESRQLAIHETLKPVRESLEKVDAKIAELEKSRTGAYAALHEQVRLLADGQTALRSETTNLVNALRSPSVRGRWGEIQLHRVVEMAGMQAHCDFFEQQTHATPDGRLRPDMRVQLPGKKTIIVDAKTPLDAYLKAVEATDEETRRSFMLAHAKKVREHIGDLSRKSYWSQFDETPELVVMFLPGEVFFSAALEADPTLIEAGIEHNIVLATPTTLIALLRAIHYGWRQEKIAQDAQRIGELGRELYKRLSDMSGHFAAIGTSLGSSVKAYNKAVASLESRVLVSARRFKDLQAATSEAEIEGPEQIEQSPRALQAPEFAPASLFPVDEPQPDVEDEDRNGDASERNLSAIADFNSGTPAPVLAETSTPASPKSAAEPR